MPKGNTHRLPDTVRPERYDIELRPDLKHFTFTGDESITIRVRQPVKSIEMHASQLEVTKATLQRPGERPLPAEKIELLEDQQRLRLTFRSSVPIGEATLRLAFSGTLNDELAGFYRSRYTMSDGAQGYMAATQFEATDARRAIPCWDEPAAKAVFEVPRRDVDVFGANQRANSGI